MRIGPVRAGTGCGALLIAAAVMLAGCSPAPAPGTDAPVQVVATFSVLADIAAEIGGDRVDVHGMVPRTADPHEYSPRPTDMQRAADADVLVWNGLNMESGNDWFAALAAATGHDLTDPTVVEASAGITPMYLDRDEAPAPGDPVPDADRINPHAFLDPVVGMTYARNICDGLIAADPDGADYYRARTADYLDRLGGIDAQYRAVIDALDPDRRLLVTSENAFQYPAARYGLTTGYLWAIDTEGQGSPAQVMALIDLMRASGVPALFVESNVAARPLRTVADDTGVPITGTVYSDALGDDDSPAATYLDLLEHNIVTIGDGLG